MRVTDEQKEREAYVNLPQFLMSHGFDLKKVGKEYVWKEHDSLHIKDNGPGERGQWFRFSENKGGDNIGLLREYMDMFMLQDKLNTYIWFIDSKQYEETYPNASLSVYEIQIKFKYQPSDFCIEYLNHVNNKLGSMNITVMFEVTD